MVVKVTGRVRGQVAVAATLLLLVAVAGAGCGTGDEGEGAAAAEGAGAGADAPVVVATTGIWADVLSNVACDGQATVETLIPVGGDPHVYEPSLADRGQMESASLVVANGLFLEEGLEDTLDAVEESGTPTFWVADHIDTIAYATLTESHDDEHEDEETHEDEHEDEHEHDGDDPHVWFDPVRVSAVLPELAEHLVDDVGLDADAVGDCLDAYQAELTAVDEELATLFDGVPETNRKLVTSHDSLGYLADRYGFEVVGTVIPAPSGLAETNPAQLEELAELIAAEGVIAIFAEAQHSDADAQALADRLGGEVEVVTLHTGSLGDAGSGADTYLGFLRTNAQLIADALA